MRDVHTTNYRDQSITASLARLWARIRPRMPRLERKQNGQFQVMRRDDNYDYIAPTPVGTLPMGKHRAR